MEELPANKGQSLNEWIKAVLDKMGITDFVEVVRCKDCIHRPVLCRTGIKPPKGAMEYDYDVTCPYLCDDPYYNHMPNDDDFCSHGMCKQEQ